jgi:hypothetical protein
MPELPPAEAGSGRIDNPRQSHDQILPANTGKSADAFDFRAPVPNHLSPPIKTRYVTKLLVICSNFHVLDRE